MTGSRVKQIQKYIPEGESFMLTYGDGVADININTLLEHHYKHGKIATITAVQSPAKYGVLDIDADDTILDFKEKPQSDAGWINGGLAIRHRGNYGRNEEIRWGKNQTKKLQILPGKFG